MNTITIKLAGYNVEIVSECRFAPTMYAGFRTDIPGECRVLLSKDDMDFSNPRLTEKHKAAVKTPHILRKTADALLEFGVILVHGVALAYAGKVYLFIAPSGMGKTTHAKQWLDNLPEACVINGDKPFIATYDDGRIPMACGSPWAGKENMYTTAMVPLKSIILLERAEHNYMEQISFAEAFPFLLQQTYRPADEEKMRKNLRLMQRLNGPVSFWRFKCNNFEDDCFKVAYTALVRDQM